MSTSHTCNIFCIYGTKLYFCAAKLYRHLREFVQMTRKEDSEELSNKKLAQEEAFSANLRKFSLLPLSRDGFSVCSLDSFLHLGGRSPVGVRSTSLHLLSAIVFSPLYFPELFFRHCIWREKQSTSLGEGSERGIASDGCRGFVLLCLLKLYIQL